MLTAGSYMISEHPLLGVGLGHFSREFYLQLEKMNQRDETGGIAEYIDMAQGRIPDHAHNDPLEIWAETGTLGLLCFLFLLSYALALLLMALRSNSEQRALAGICLALIVTILVESLFSFPLHLPVRATLFWAVLILGARSAIPTSPSLTETHENSASA